MKKIFFITFIILFISNGFGAVIIIDPGHGGEDKGASSYYKGKKIYEKTLTLVIAKQIHKYLSKKHSVYLTRSLDRTISLEKRADMATKLKADFFISLHINSGSKTAHGFETYYLDNKRNAAVHKVEDIENRDTKGTQHEINQILIDLIIKNTVVGSRSFAKAINSEINRSISKRYKMTNRGVKSGLFYVLALSKIPAVLLEVGFLSNKGELKKLMRKDFQRRYAKAVSKATIRHFSTQRQKTVPLF